MLGFVHVCSALTRDSWVVWPWLAMTSDLTTSAKGEERRWKRECEYGEGLVREHESYLEAKEKGFDFKRPIINT